MGFALPNPSGMTLLSWGQRFNHPLREARGKWIAVTQYSSKNFHILKWDGSSLTTKDTYTFDNNTSVVS